MTAFEDLFLLRAFVSIVESGSISAGARRLKLSQPTLSRHLRDLEERCGAVLIRRDTHGMSLTETGVRFLSDAQAMLAHAEAAEQRLRDDPTMLSGHLRLFATIDCGQSIVTRLVSEFLKTHPKVTASLAMTNRPMHVIQEGCDVGLLPGKITDESVIARPAGVIRLHLVASTALAKSRPRVKELAQLADWPWIALAGPQFWSSSEVRLFSRTGEEQSLRIHPVLISEGVHSIREAVRSGLGVAALPDWLVRDDLLAGRLVQILPHWQTRDLPIHVVYAGQRVLPLRVSAFIDHAVRYMTRALDPRNAAKGL